MMPSILGKVIDNYRIVEVLGKGGMGVVYKATDLTLDRDVALKMMDESLARDESFLKRFQSEARALAKVQNQHIVSIFALRETEVGFCIVMEFVSGITLADVIRKGKISSERALPIFRQVLSALGHAHGAGIVHRDIKPSNIMITDNDTVKVTDFGLAKIQQPSAATMTVGTGGTLYYMPPEQVRGLANVDHRGDIYSTGMSLYEALVGKTPFSDDETDFSIRQAIVEGKIVSPEKMNPSLPKDIVRVIQKSIEKDPAKRYQSATEFIEALEQCAAQASAKGVRSAAGSIHQEQPRPRSKVMPVAVSIAVLLLIAFVYYMISGSTETGRINLRSVPDQAAVKINNKNVGLTPLSNYVMDPGTFSVRLEKDGYRSLDTSFSLGAGADFNARLALVEETSSVPVNNNNGSELGNTEKGKIPTKEIGTLVVEAVPSTDVQVRIDNSLVSFAGKNTIEREHASGQASVVFEHSSGAQKRFNVNVQAGKRQRITCYFETEVAIQALANDQPVYAAVEVNGKAASTGTPTTLKLLPGNYRIEVTKFGYSSNEGSVEISVEPSSERKKIPLVFHLLKTN